MNARIFASSAIALVAILAASAAYAQGGPGRRGRGGHGMGQGPRIMGQLDLSEEQQAQIRQLRREAREESSAAREDLRQLGAELRQLWDADPPNASAILAKHRQMDALRSVLRAGHTELRAEIEGILTAEQQARMAELVAERPGRGGGHGRMGRGRRGMGAGGPGMGGRGMGGMMAERLGLSEDQQAQIRALRQQAREATADERAALQQIRQEAREQRSSGQADAAAIDALRERGAAARRAIREQQVHTRIAILGLLDSEQRAALSELREQRHERRGARRGSAE